jgi:hypothetical protein
MTIGVPGVLVKPPILARARGYQMPRPEELPRPRPYRHARCAGGCCPQTRHAAICIAAPDTRIFWARTNGNVFIAYAGSPPMNNVRYTYNAAACPSPKDGKAPPLSGSGSPEKTWERRASAPRRPP